MNLKSSSTTRKKHSHPVTQYALDVRDEKILAGRLVRLACERHLRDLEEGPTRGLHFDEAKATNVIEFFHKFLTLGEDRLFLLSAWQSFIVGSLFGWTWKATGLRRFRQAYIETGKGSGKTPMLGGIGLLGLLADGEEAAEIYSAAPSLNQAKIPFADAEKMLDRAALLNKRCKRNLNNIAVERTNSFFRPISSERRSLDGPRVHFGLIDELHEHRDATVFDKIRAGTKGRKQPLIIAITNSGYDRHSIAWRQHEYSTKILERIFENDSFFAYVCGLDTCENCRKQGKDQPSEGCATCDDFRDERVWIKGNPNLDVSVTRQYLREQVQEAIEMPSKQNIVKRLNFCMWTEQSVRWLNLDLWDRGAKPVPSASLLGRSCFLGMDLARSHDLSALAALFPPVEQNEPWKLLMRFWIPEGNVEARVRRDRVPYDVWIREGCIRTTPGEATDFGFIEKEILELAGQYQIEECAFDRTFADSLVQRLMAEGLAMVEFGQGFLSMAAPCGELERLLISGQLQHGGHPVLRWNATNVAVSRDAAGNMKPDKVGSTERIDGVVALLNALGRAMVHGPKPKAPQYAITVL